MTTPKPTVIRMVRWRTPGRQTPRPHLVPQRDVTGDGGGGEDDLRHTLGGCVVIGLRTEVLDLLVREHLALHAQLAGQQVPAVQPRYAAVRSSQLGPCIALSSRSGATPAAGTLSGTASTHPCMHAKVITGCSGGSLGGSSPGSAPVAGFDSDVPPGAMLVMTLAVQARRT